MAVDLSDLKDVETRIGQASGDHERTLLSGRPG